MAFADFRHELGDEDYLKILKTVFGEEQHECPVLYRVLDETPRIRRLVTTNFDEFLATCAEDNDWDRTLATYPRFRPVDARFVYLHGRASTATTADDLVLCENAYSRAYLHPYAPAALQLSRNLTGDMLFIGCSLDDPDLRRILKDLRRLRDVGGKDVGPKPFAILGVDTGKAPPDMRIATGYLRFYGVRPIWYRHSGDYAELSTLLYQLRHEVQRPDMYDVYLEQTKEIDLLCSIDHPDEERKERLLELLRDTPVLRNHFLRNAFSPAWYEVLRDSGMLTDVSEPTVGDEGRILLTSWGGAPYVRRIAQARPDAVAELISHLQRTKNWQVHGVLSELASSLSDQQLSEALPVLQAWRRSEFAGTGLVELNLITLFAAVADQGYEAAYTLLEDLLLPDHQVMGGRAMEAYHLEQMEPGVRKLTADTPRRAYAVLKACLLASLTDIEQQSALFRAAIEEHDQNVTQMDPLRHALVAWTRDALLALIRAEPSRAPG